MKIRIVKCIIFSIIFCLLFFTANNILMQKDITKPENYTVMMHGLENEEKNSFDVMFFGASGTYCTFNPTVIFQKSGITSYVYASPAQYIWGMYHYIIEALKYQSPKVVVIGLNSIIQADEEYMPSIRNHMAMDYLPLSENKIKMIQVMAPGNEQLEYYIPFIAYHSRWSSLSAQDFNFHFLQETSETKGYLVLTEISPQKLNRKILQSRTQVPISEKAEKYLNKIIELSKQKGFKLVFEISPLVLTDLVQGRSNAIKKLAEEQNIPVIDFNQLYDELNLDENTDFRDDHHLNYMGSEKVSAYIADYLSQGYDLEDKRNNSEINNQWKGYYESYLSAVGAALDQVEK